MFEVIRALDSLSFPFTQGDRRNQCRDQQGKNDDDHEQFNQREGPGVASRGTAIHDTKITSTNNAAPAFRPKNHFTLAVPAGSPRQRCDFHAISIKDASLRFALPSTDTERLQVPFTKFIW